MSKNLLRERMLAHFGHNVVIAAYGDLDDPENVALECEDCGCVIFDDGAYDLCEAAKEEEEANVQETLGKTYIHYGSKVFNREIGFPVRNRHGHNKPFGGLWASATDAKCGWKQWCEREEFKRCDEGNAFRFTLKESARVLVLNSEDKVKELPNWTSNYEYLGVKCIDWAKVAKDYDVVDYQVSKDYGLHTTLYGWDCDSILVLNPDVVVPA